MKLKALCLFAALGGLAACAIAQQWGMYGGNPQHTAEALHGVQRMSGILWQTPIDLSPPYDGTDLLIHYGCPTISSAGTVVLAVRNGGSNGFPTANDTYQIEGHSLSTGATVYTATTDFVDWMPHDWTPSLSTAIDSNDVLYYPGAGGTIYRRASANAASSTVTQLCFYGISNYSSNPSAFNSGVQIDTPIVVDSHNNIYFGFYVDPGFVTSGSNTAGLSNGIAKITAAGATSWVAISSLTGESGDEIQCNCEPAISNDGTHLYAATKYAPWYYYGNPKLIELNTSNLALVHSVNLTISASTPSDPQSWAYVMDDGTSSPLVGPDGDVYFGVWYQNIARGFMLHYSGDLGTQKYAGAFGWDDTAAVVPSYIVPSYHGTSPYLICTKYNNYGDYGAYGDGANKVALLDPNASETYTIQYGTNNPGYQMVGDNQPGTTTGASYTTMKEIATLLGVTSNASEGLEGVREWCVNTVAIDVPGKGAVVNSEDGHTYRWDFRTNSITDNMNLEPPTGEAYTPTLASSDGIAIAVNNATVFALWDGVKPSAVTTNVGSTITSGYGATGTVTLTGAATGPGATLQITSDNPAVTVPATLHIAAGATSGNFAITTAPLGTAGSATIKACRYGFSTTLLLTLNPAPTLSISVVQRVDGGTVPDGTVITLKNDDGTNLSSATTSATVSGTAVFKSPPTPTAPNTSYEAVVSPPPGSHGVSAVQHGVLIGTSTTVYYTAIRATIIQALIPATPVASATLSIGAASVSTAANGVSAPLWVPDGTFTATFAMNPGRPCLATVTVGSSSTSNLVSASGYASITAHLTRIYFTARYSSGASYVPKTGTWSITPGSLSGAVNGQAISQGWWLPNGAYSGSLSGATANGTSSFNVGAPSTATGQRIITVS